MLNLQGRVPSLDGLRGVGVILVLLCHLLGTPGFPTPVPGGRLPSTSWFQPGRIGDFAMGMFFVLSGFLITEQLLRELASTGRISLGRFYLRRSLRILPVAYAYIIPVGIAAAIWNLPFGIRDWITTLTFTSNYDPRRSTFIFHFWSLALEEQFYLLWPIALLLFGSRRALSVLATVMVACPVIRLALALTVSGSSEFRHWLPVHADAFAAGCLLSCARDRIWDIGWYRRLVSSRWMWTLSPALAVIFILRASPAIRYGVFSTIAHIGLMICLDYWMRFPGDALNPVLNTPLTMALGRMSYSLYVWQWVFVNRYFPIPGIHFPMSLAATLLVGYLSYRWIENPMHQFGRNLIRTLEKNDREKQHTFAAAS